MNEMSLRVVNVNLDVLRLTSATVSGAPIPVMVIGALALLTGAWAFWDARRRGRSGLLAALLVVTTWPFSLAWWPWLRPDVLPAESGQVPATS